MISRFELAGALGEQMSGLEGATAGTGDYQQADLGQLPTREPVEPEPPVAERDPEPELEPEPALEVEAEGELESVAEPEPEPEVEAATVFEQEPLSAVGPRPAAAELAGEDQLHWHAC